MPMSTRASRCPALAALFNAARGEEHRARSAGSRPADHVHPTVVDAMRELGFDLSAQTPHKLTQDDMQWADLVVTMGCGDECPYVPGKRYVDWELDDPGGQPIETVREVRDEIGRRVELLLADMGADRGGLA